MVEVTVGGRRQFEGTEADVIQSLVVNTVRLVRVFDELMNRQSRIVRLHHCVRHLSAHHNTVHSYTPSRLGLVRNLTANTFSDSQWHSSN